MLLPVDIDQLLGVKRIYHYRRTNKLSILLLRNVNGISYLPKELFNMTQLKHIYANVINSVRDHICYNSKTEVSNHIHCRWSNLVNLS